MLLFSSWRRLALGSLVILFAASARADTESEKPPFNTLKITYKTKSRVTDADGKTLFTSAGREVKYIDAVKNMKRSERSEVTVMGDQRNSTESIDLFDGTTFYRLDPVLKKGNFVDLQGQEKAVWREAKTEESYYIGEQKVLGRVCKVYGYQFMKIWTWNHVILKQEMNYKNSSQQTVAVKMKENIPLRPELFELPKDYQIQTFGESVAGTLDDLFTTMDEIKTMRAYVAQRSAATQVDGDSPKMQKLLAQARDAAGITRTAKALEAYKEEVGSYPTLEQGLDALLRKPTVPPVPTVWKGPYVSSIKDVWGNELVYRLPGIYNPNGYDLYSKGEDGTGDGTENDDVNNWK